MAAQTPHERLFAFFHASDEAKPEESSASRRHRAATLRYATQLGDPFLRLAASGRDYRQAARQELAQAQGVQPRAASTPPINLALDVFIQQRDLDVRGSTPRRCAR